MGINQSFLIELEKEIASTKKLIACVPNDKWDWKPHEKSMSVGDLAKHITELVLWTANITEKDNLNFHTNYAPLDAKSTDELLKLIDEFYAESKKSIEGFDENKWMQDWSLKAGDHEIAKMPKVAANRFIVNNHIYHHRGQLSVYLRLLDVPIPGMYGPSADER